MENMGNKLPNFLIVGAAKSGTTPLYYYLKQHPDIFIPEMKECRFFSEMPVFQGPQSEIYRKRSTLDLDAYKLLFAPLTSEKAIGDVSPDYLYFYQNSIKNIKKIIGEPKIIITLRNPVDRAFSNYLHLVRGGWEPKTFEEALKSEKSRKAANELWVRYYTDIGFYYEQVRAYKENLKNVKVYIYDDFKEDNMVVLKDIFSYLEVDNSFVPDIGTRYNVSGVPKNRFIHSLLAKSNIIKTLLKPLVSLVISKEQRIKTIETHGSKLLTKPHMKPETREYLIDLYREDILKLQDYIKRDLNHWLK